jgi:superfamily I DNA/RNA helicase
VATLAISRDMLLDWAKLQKPLQAQVAKLADTFQKLTAAELRAAKGVHLERYEGQLDPGARTVRLGQGFRGVVLDAGDNETFILTKVDTHENIDLWMLHNRFRVNEATGALEIVNPSAVQTAVDEAVKEASSAGGGAALYAHRKDKEFRQLGVDPNLLPALRAFTKQDQLYAILGAIPENQGEALMLLLGEESVDDLYPLVAGTTAPGEVDVDDFAAAVLAPASRQLFHIVADEAELQDMLAQPLSQWRTYLHHTQHEAAYRPVYNGPARITGGAGTGKTVVALHRAAYLASQLGEHAGGKPILFTTYTRNLAQSIERDLRSLAGSEVLDLVEVVNVDSLAHKLVSGAESGTVKVASDDSIRQVWDDVVDELGTEFSRDFLNAELEQVILAQGIGARSDYFAATRSGRGVRLDRRARAEVWKAVEAFLREFTSRSERTYLQLAQDAAGYLAGRTVKPYRHIVVDEAQDLHETQWRLLRAAVAEGPNDLFIVGDSHQRIYDRRASLSQVGINIVGRSRRLRINYRTTREILNWSLAFLGEGSYDDLDTGCEEQASATYHSFLHGNRPTMAGFHAKAEQLDAAVQQVREWIGGGVPEEEVAVAARAKGSLDQAEAALKRGGVAVVRLGSDLPGGEGVRLGTMHRLKGLEFRCVALIDLDDDSMPLPWALTAKADDEVQHNADLRRERCTAYVAATRARDDLWVGWSGKPSRFLLPLLASEADV